MFTLVAVAALTMGPVCPSRIETSQRMTSTPGGWSAEQKKWPHDLSGVVIYYDNPSTLLELMPDSTSKDASGRHFVYVLPFRRKEAWVECSYSSTSVVLRKKVPATVKRCQVTLETNRNIVKKISCS